MTELLPAIKLLIEAVALYYLAGAAFVALIVAVFFVVCAFSMLVRR